MTHASGEHLQPITLGDFHICLDGSRIHTARASDTVEDAETIMDVHDIDQVPVVDPKLELRVLTRRMIAAMSPADRTSTLVANVQGIDDPPLTLPASTPLSDAYQILVDHDWVITTDGGGEAVGLATVGDALEEAMTRLNTYTPSA